MTRLRSLLLVFLCLCLLPFLPSCGSENDDDDDDDATSDTTPDGCVDDDKDGYCTKASADVGTAYDCDDADASVNPAATEICNGVDEDCDGTADDGLPKDNLAWIDEDLDDYGYGIEPVMKCAVFKGYAANGDDCDDTNAEIHPGVCELPDSLDNDCDGVIDEPENACHSLATGP